MESQYYKDLIKSEFTYYERRERILNIYDAYMRKARVILAKATLIRCFDERRAVVSKVPNFPDTVLDKYILLNGPEEASYILDNEKRLNEHREYIKRMEAGLVRDYERIGYVFKNDFRSRHLGLRSFGKLIRRSAGLNHTMTCWAEHHAGKITVFKEDKYLDYLSWQNEALYKIRLMRIHDDYKDAWFRRYYSLKARGIIRE